MEYRPYGGSGIEVSAIAYGAMSIAADPGIRGEVAPSLLKALENGITLIDTARGYPNSERLIAGTLKEWGGPRPVISTKLAPLSRETFRHYQPVQTAYTAQSIRASVEASLQALQVDTLDIVHLHQWHYLWTHEPVWLDALQGLKREGKLRAFAVSAQDHEHDALLEAISTKMIDGAQIILNLFESRPMGSLLPLARQHDTGVIARCALDSGGLSDTLAREDFARRPFLKNAPFDEYKMRLDELRKDFIPSVAAGIPELAVRFALSAPGVSSVTLGMPAVSFVEDALAWAKKGALEPETMEAIRRGHVWTKNFYEHL